MRTFFFPSITFCGITMKNYVERNISSKSQTTLKYAMKMLSGSSETIIFMFLGVATIHDDHEWDWAFVCCTIFFCTFFRIVGGSAAFFISCDPVKSLPPAIFSLRHPFFLAAVVHVWNVSRGGEQVGREEEPFFLFCSGGGWREMKKRPFSYVRAPPLGEIAKSENVAETRRSGGGSGNCAWLLFTRDNKNYEAGGSRRASNHQRGLSTHRPRVFEMLFFPVRFQA